MSDRPVLDGKEVESQDVEITAEMLEAGEAELQALQGAVSGASLVGRVYTAMVRASLMRPRGPQEPFPQP